MPDIVVISAKLFPANIDSYCLVAFDMSDGQGSCALILSA